MDDVLPPRARPFGPLPRAAVAIYGVLLAGAGLTLSLQTRKLNGFGAAGVNALLIGIACVVLAARVGRAPRAVEGADDPDDTRVVAARIVSELADLERQVDELTEQCATFDAHRADVNPHDPAPLAPH
jgi:hypothetical protein